MTKNTVIPFGPQHPVLPEPLQLRLTMEDGRVVEAIPSIGYIHRGLEKLAERKDFIQDVYLIERVCGICSFIHSQAYCQGIETLLGIEPPARAKYLRVFWAELHRLHSHLLWLGLFADSFGFESLFMQVWRIREGILGLMEATAGARIMLGTCCIGGVRRDVPDADFSGIRSRVESLRADTLEILPAVRDDITVKTRTVGVGVLSAEAARVTGAVGPVAKACGIALDHRTRGYAAYGDLDFEVVTHTEGDSYARMLVRCEEILQSFGLVEQALAKMPATPIATPFRGNPDGETIERVEQPRGEVMYYLRANGSPMLDRVRIRTPTFANVPALLAMVPGCSTSDVPVIILSIDPCISCTER